MDLAALLRKDLLSVRRNLGLFVLLLVVLPGMLVLGTVVYEQALPRDVPVGVVGANESTTQTDISITTAGVDFFATPVEYDDRDAALDALRREQIYLIVEVPSGITEEGNTANYTVVSDDSLTPFQSASNLTVSAMDGRLDDFLPADVNVQHDRIDQRRQLSEYLVPSTLLLFVAVYALVFVPAQVRRERLVLDRIQTESRIETFVASKLLLYGALFAVPVATVVLLTRHLGYDLALFRPFTLAVLGLTFLYLAAIGLAVQFAARLEDTATYVNLGLGAVVLSFSSIVYPVGFFSTTRKEIARAMPTHYSMIGIRSGALKDVPASLYTDYLWYVAITTVLALVALELSIVFYRWRR